MQKSGVTKSEQVLPGTAFKNVLVANLGARTMRCAVSFEKKIPKVMRKEAPLKGRVSGGEFGLLFLSVAHVLRQRGRQTSRGRWSRPDAPSRAQGAT